MYVKVPSFQGSHMTSRRARHALAGFAGNECVDLFTGRSAPCADSAAISTSIPNALSDPKNKPLVLLVFGTLVLMGVGYLLGGEL